MTRLALATLVLLVLANVAAEAQQPPSEAPPIVVDKQRDIVQTLAPKALAPEAVDGASYGELVQWLTSRGIGRKLFGKNIHGEIRIEQLREMVKGHMSREAGTKP